MRQNLRSYAGMLAGLSTFLICIICLSPFILLVLGLLIAGLLTSSVGPKSMVQKTNMKCNRAQRMITQFFFKKMMSSNRR